MMKKALLTATVVAFLAACSTSGPTPDEMPEEGQIEETTEEIEGDSEPEPVEVVEEDSVRAALEAAVAGEHRSEEARARDEFRHPVETLLFFGIEPDMTVVELSPGGGWYSSILVPFLSEGRLVAGNFDFDPDNREHYTTVLGERYIQWAQGEGGKLGSIELGVFAPGGRVEIGEPGSADMVVTFRNFHSWYNAGVLEDALQAAYEVLRPGGVLGVVAHRADAGSDVEETAPKGYLPQDFVIEEVEKAGFELAGTSEVNANPDDTKDYPEGVWALPPSLRGENSEELKSIGESDRMTLRFIKPQE